MPKSPPKNLPKNLPQKPTGTATLPGTVPGLILAGGQARRMGGADKPLMPLAGRPLIAHVLARLAPQCGTMAISANGDPARFATFGLPVLADDPPPGVPGHAGPLAGLLAGLDWAAALGADRLLTSAADTPFLPPDLLARLAPHPGLVLAATPGEDPHHPRPQPVTGLWPVACRGALREALIAGERRIGFWARQQGAVLVPFSPPPGRPDPFLNINTPEDLEKAHALL